MTLYLLFGLPVSGIVGCLVSYEVVFTKYYDNPKRLKKGVKRVGRAMSLLTWITAAMFFVAGACV
jgi:membrane protein required for beta-lactamase induction